MNFLDNIKPKNLVKFSILFSIIIFFCINIIINNVFNSSRIDFTEKKLYSLSNSTIDLLENLIHVQNKLSCVFLNAQPTFNQFVNGS